MVVLNVSRYGLPFFTALAAGLSVQLFTAYLQQYQVGTLTQQLSLGLFSVRKLTFVRTVSYLVAQALGALAACSFNEYFTQRTLKNLPTSFDWRIVIAEAVGALIFAIGYAAVVYQKQNGCKVPQLSVQPYFGCYRSRFGI